MYIKEFIKFDFLSSLLVTVAKICKITSSTKLLFRISFLFSAQEFPTAIYFLIKIGRNPTSSIKK